MSVTFFIIQEDGSFGSESVPVSSQKYFVDTWLKLSAELDLKHIPLFEAGATFNETDLSGILQELSILQEACRLQFNDSESILERIDLLKKTLLELKNRSHVQFFIG